MRSVEHDRQRVSITNLLHDAKKSWQGVRLNQPDWGDNSHSLAVSAELRNEGLGFHLILNGYWEPLDFELPLLASGGTWRRWIDTGLDSPSDIVPWKESPPVSGNSYRAEARSVVMLLSGMTGQYE